MTGRLSDKDLAALGEELFGFAEELFPICRSITGDGLRTTLGMIGGVCPLEVTEVPTGEKVLDWTVPQEWNIRDAYVEDPAGKRIVDFAASNLSVVNYSAPVNGKFTLEELDGHLHSIPDQPELIPYRTSYYSQDWGFCLPHKVRESLEPGMYNAVIDSSLSAGSLSYGECVIRGSREEEILISAHSCHPSLANDNLSGIAVAAFLARSMKKITPRYTYRFLFAPGTIGAIAWLARNEEIAARIKVGFVLSNLGDKGPINYKKARREDSYLNRIVESVLRAMDIPYGIHAFSPYGYDERQFCSPGFNLDVGSLSRSRWGTFPEYHTSGDNMSFITPEALADSYHVLASFIEAIECDSTWENMYPKGEPQLGSRGLYDLAGEGGHGKATVMNFLWILNYSDGKHSLMDISRLSGVSVASLYEAASLLHHQGLIRKKS